MVKQLSFRAALLYGATHACLQAAYAGGGGPALPRGGAYVAGSGQIAAANGKMTITQSGARGVIDWNSFSIGKSGQVQFQNGAGATLNVVTGNLPSRIGGLLSATGSVYLINPQGIVVTHGGTVITGGGFVASTRPADTAGFMSNGTLTMSGTSAGNVTNAGSIEAGGDVVLVGNAVTNFGSVSAGGQAALAAGNQIVLQPEGDSSRVIVSGGAGDVTNKGGIQAAQVALKSAGGDVYALAGKAGGYIHATGTAKRNGRVMLEAGGNVSVTGSVSADGASGGMVAVNAGGAASVGGTVSARGTAGAGGTIVVSGSSVAVGSSGRLDASGTTNGGVILAGGDRHGGQTASQKLVKRAVPNARTTTIAAGAVLAADGAAGNGGSVVVWSQQQTGFSGLIEAAGGINGGFAEISSQLVLNETGTVNMRGGSGAAGSLLLDPTNVYITTGTVPGGASAISPATIESNLLTANVTIDTSGNSGNIFVESPVTFSSANTLGLAPNPFGSVTVAAGMTSTGSGAILISSFNGPIEIDASMQVAGLLQLQASSSNNSIIQTAPINAGTLSIYGSTIALNNPGNTIGALMGYGYGAVAVSTTGNMTIPSALNIGSFNQAASLTLTVGGTLTLNASIQNTGIGDIDINAGGFVQGSSSATIATFGGTPYVFLPSWTNLSTLTTFLNHDYGVSPGGSVPAGDNGFLFAQTPTATVTVAASTYTYGSSANAGWSAVSGLVLNDTSGNAVTGNVTLSPSPTAAGTFAVSGTGLTSPLGYVLNYTTTTVTVAQKTLSVALGSGTITTQYGTAANVGSVTLTGVINGDSVTPEIEVIKSGTTTAVGSTLAAGLWSETVQLTGPQASNYRAVATGSARLDVTKAPLTWSVADAIGNVGTVAVPGTATLNGTVPGDTVTGTVKVTQNGTVVTLTTATPAGTYLETVSAIGGASASNYSLAAVGDTIGTLVISAAGVTTTPVVTTPTTTPVVTTPTTTPVVTTPVVATPTTTPVVATATTTPVVTTPVATTASVTAFTAPVLQPPPPAPVATFGVPQVTLASLNVGTVTPEDLGPLPMMPLSTLAVSNTLAAADTLTASNTLTPSNTLTAANTLTASPADNATQTAPAPTPGDAGAQGSASSASRQPVAENADQAPPPRPPPSVTSEPAEPAPPGPVAAAPPGPGVSPPAQSAGSPAAPTAPPAPEPAPPPTQLALADPVPSPGPPPAPSPAPSPGPSPAPSPGPSLATPAPANAPAPSEPPAGSLAQLSGEAAIAAAVASGAATPAEAQAIYDNTVNAVLAPGGSPAAAQAAGQRAMRQLAAASTHAGDPPTPAEQLGDSLASGGPVASDPGLGQALASGMPPNVAMVQAAARQAMAATMLAAAAVPVTPGNQAAASFSQPPAGSAAGQTTGGGGGSAAPGQTRSGPDQTSGTGVAGSGGQAPGGAASGPPGPGQEGSGNGQTNASGAVTLGSDTAPGGSTSLTPASGIGAGAGLAQPGSSGQPGSGASAPASGAASPTPASGADRAATPGPSGGVTAANGSPDAGNPGAGTAGAATPAVDAPLAAALASGNTPAAALAQAQMAAATLVAMNQAASVPLSAPGQNAARLASGSIAPASANGASNGAVALAHGMSPEAASAVAARAAAELGAEQARATIAASDPAAASLAAGAPPPGTEIVVRNGVAVLAADHRATQLAAATVPLTPGDPGPALASGTLPPALAAMIGADPSLQAAIVARVSRGEPLAQAIARASEAARAASAAAAVVPADQLNVALAAGMIEPARIAALAAGTDPALFSAALGQALQRGLPPAAAVNAAQATAASQSRSPIP